MPEGDSLRAIASRMQPLVGDAVRVEAVHPRARVLQIAPRLDGRRLLAVDARGKNLLLRFEPELVLVSHLTMRGRWRVQALCDAGELRGQPWLRITGDTHEATQWNGPVLELGDKRLRRLGPDILEEPPPLEQLVDSLRRAAQERAIGDVLLDQRVIAGVGNLWRSELLFAAGIAPQTRLREVSDAALGSFVESSAAAMSDGRSQPRVYRRARQACRVCATVIQSRPLGEHGRSVYWCPGCQAGNAGHVT